MYLRLGNYTRMNIMHARSLSQLFLQRHVIIFRGTRYVSSVANFELAEINNIFKCLGGLIIQKYVRLGEGGTSQTFEGVQGGGDPKSMKLNARTLCMAPNAILQT